MPRLENTSFDWLTDGSTRSGAWWLTDVKCRQLAVSNVLR